ncbi:MAG: type I-E CRISPR-associated protein Cse2/CasB [bacterium]
MTDQSVSVARVSTAREWWNQVRLNPGAQAKLRRSRDRIEGMLIPQALQLARRLKATGPDDPQFGTAIDLARVLAHIRSDNGERPMRAVGWPSFPRDGGDGSSDARPRLSEVRFKRLLRSTAGEDRVSAFIRLIALMEGHANVAAIADAFRQWDHPDGRVKQRWAFEYFNAAQAAPAAATTVSEENSQS